MRWERIIATVVALGVAVFSGFVFIGMSEVGDPNVVLAAVVLGLSLLAAAVIAIGPAKWAAGLAIALGVISGLGAIGTLATVPSGPEMALDVIWLGVTTLVLIGAGLRLLRQPGEPNTPPVKQEPVAGWDPTGDRRCPHCGKAVAPDRVRYCNHCGEGLVAPSRAP